MNNDELFRAGQISKLYGYKGELITNIDSDLINEFPEGEPVFIQIEGKPVPYFFKIIHINPDGKIRIKIDGVDSEVDARKFLKSNIYFRKTLLKKDSTASQFDSIINFKVIDKQLSEIGFVEDYSILTYQTILHVRWNKKEILIPYVDSIIEKIDTENKILYINAPEGLIELYL
ncbi:MAG: hypothetical protein Q8880_10055 [Bacteroidota bacterium]|nr:hypothetical protein [Bacteroidota bacterium]